MRPTPTRTEDLASSIAARIQARTHGQVRDLKVVLAESNVVISGRALTHYAKQLASGGILEIAAGREVVNQIEVV